MEIQFPFEYTVEGVPVSQANRDRRGQRTEWHELVRASYVDLLPEAHWSTQSSIYLTILYFPAGRMQGDIDNIVKPLLDIMSRHLYVDDRQVERVIVQKFEPDRLVVFADPTDVLRLALRKARPVLYVRLDDDGTAKGLWS